MTAANCARAVGALFMVILAAALGILLWAARPAAAAPRQSGLTPPCGLGWSAVASPNATPNDNALNGISAASATDIWAVGSYTNTNGLAQTLTEHWDGSSWTAVPSPNINDTGNNLLQAVTTLPSSEAWAVGYYSSGTNWRTLITHWDGTQWTIVSSPNVGDTENYLYGVAAVSPTDAWAVGYYNSGSFYRTFTVRWNGTAWSTVTSPNPTLSLAAGLRGVTVVSPNEVWAVGGYAGLSLTLQTLAMRWNGASWTIVITPNTGSGNNGLTAVTAVGAGDVWAAGVSNNGTRYLTLTQHWNGSNWSIISSPSLGTGDNALGGITALAANDVWAVGGYTGDYGPVTLALHWDGTAWTQSPSDDPGTADNRLLAVTSRGGGALWASGSFKNTGGASQTLVERYGDSGPCPTGSATVTATAPAATNTSTPAVSTQTPTATATPSGSTPTLTATPAAGTPTNTNTPAAGTSTATTTPSSASPTVTPTATPTLCAINFSDVQPTDYFYTPVRYLYCHGAISGYSDGTFRPYNNTTRGQLSKIVVLAEGFPIDTTGGPHFTDVPTSNPFYVFIETAYNRSLISGYSDSTFRPGNNVTRAQLCKIVVIAEGWPIDTTGGPHFSDVPTTDPFYSFIETAYNHTIISGYSDGTFRPGANATRGQISKIVYSAITQP